MAHSPRYGAVPVFFLVFFLVLSSLLVGCADDSTEPAPDSGATADTGPAADGGSDGGGDGAVPDASPPDATPADGSRPVASGHASFVPRGLTPEAATRLVILGDSISAGVGASGSAKVYHALLGLNDDAAYPVEAATDLESLTGSPVEVVDVAVSGARTRNLESQMTALRSSLTLPASGHTVVVVTIGGNDLSGAISGGDPTGGVLTAALRNIRLMVQFFQNPGNFPDGVSIYVGNVYDPSDGEAQIATCFFGLSLPQLVAAMDVWRDEYESLGAEMGFAVVDMLGAFHGHAHHHDNTMNPYYDTADPTPWFADCLHPNDRGHHELRRIFYEAMDFSYRAD